MAEVIALEQQLFAGDFRQRVGETVAEVQPGRVTAALPEVTVGVSGDHALVVCHRLDMQVRSSCRRWRIDTWREIRRIG
jgi:hypothetical protein